MAEQGGSMARTAAAAGRGGRPWRCAALLAVLLWLAVLGVSLLATARGGDDGLIVQASSFAPRDPAAARDGLPVVGVAPGSPADRAGLGPGDVLLALGGVPVGDTGTLARRLFARRAGDAATLRVRRVAAEGPAAASAQPAVEDVALTLAPLFTDPDVRATVATYARPGL